VGFISADLLVVGGQAPALHKPDYDKTLLEQLSQVTAESVRQVASKYFKTDAYVLASAGKRP